MNSWKTWLIGFLVSTASLEGWAAAQSSVISTYGDGSCAGWYVPTFHTGGEIPTLGNTAFRVISENLTGGVPGILLVSARKANLTIPGVTFYVFPFSCLALQIPQATAGGAGAGVATTPIGIPNDPMLEGARLYLQGFYVDPTAGPEMIQHTKGMELTIRHAFPREAAILHDRLKYQDYFKGVSATNVDLLGRWIWSSNQIPNFNYLRMEKFTCWSQSHWMMIVRHDTGIEFCLVPGGSFKIGDNMKFNFSAFPNPMIRIEPFLMARTEVTQAQFEQVMGSSPWKGMSMVGTGPNCPATYITWSDSVAFCVKTGLRLPTEAEWEYACRAGTDTCYSFLENAPSANLSSYAWFDSNTKNANPPEAYAHEVAQKLPNSFGLFDMHGNVAEICEDKIDNILPTYGCVQPDGRARIDPSFAFNIARGGSWLVKADLCCSYSRLDTRLNRSPWIGFRPIRPLRP